MNHFSLRRFRKALDKEILKKALLLGIGSGVLTWTLFSGGHAI
jgi:hypothetical protein